ncbi:FMN-binding glutamate synthase family protein [Marininema halotolerans]|nr:FMN-binding glutamate synthase family protein [Marininema halotolerans]
MGLDILLILVVLTPLVLVIWVIIVDRNQQEHSILRNYPLLGKARYILEKIGPELRQYLFQNDTEGKPFSRHQYETIVKRGKYLTDKIGFGSVKNFEEGDWYVVNSMFPRQMEEQRVDREQSPVTTSIYHIEDDGLFYRKEHRQSVKQDPWLLPDEDAIVVGNACVQPWRIKGLVGMSAMSYGALGEKAITALSKGLGLAKGTWMNTGEGGLTKYHLQSDVDILMQIGPGLFGVRDKNGEFDWGELKKKSEIEQVRAFELKLGQGAKIRGGHVDGEKVTPSIAEIRGVEVGKDIDSPNRFRQFDDLPSLFAFIKKVREVSGKPVGMKIVVGNRENVASLAQAMKESGEGPDFITVDGGEGGTGASYQDLADGVGLPLRSALMLTDQALREYGVRDRVKIIASGKLITPDTMAVALGLGADLIHVARGLMFSVGCIQALRCHTNRCPVGVATTDPKLQRALVVEEKQYRVANYVMSLRKGLFRVAASAGLTSPVDFDHSHVVYKDRRDRVFPTQE